ncbi:MAG: LysE family transporter [Saprospiraceae bacterium]|nr:LysE family transporter [Saprospiraceae bacterium]
MGTVIDGIKIGMILGILVGPIFFALVQAGVERGVRAGTAVGLGIWISDLLFITGIYFGISYVDKLVTWPDFSFYLGAFGSLILLGFGLGTLLTRPPSVDIGEPSSRERQNTPYLSLWLKGFLINTINPFTVFFWTGLISTTLIDDKLAAREALLFFGSILMTIVFMDFLKVVLAKRIRRWLNPLHIMRLRRISGLALIVFGFILMVRVVT